MTVAELREVLSKVKAGDDDEVRIELSEDNVPGWVEAAVLRVEHSADDEEGEPYRQVILYATLN